MSAVEGSTSQVDDAGAHPDTFAYVVRQPNPE